MVVIRVKEIISTSVKQKYVKLRKEKKRKFKEWKRTAVEGLHQKIKKNELKCLKLKRLQCSN